jgi:hypothetical protein
MLFRDLFNLLGLSDHAQFFVGGIVLMIVVAMAIYHQPHPRGSDGWGRCRL